LELKSVQTQSTALYLDITVEVRKDRPGLLGYVAAKDINAPFSEGGTQLAFLAYWNISSMTKGLFLYLQTTFSSHRGHILHEEQERVWVQWEPTWVYYKDLGSGRKSLLLQLHDDPEALLRRFHKTCCSVFYPLKDGKTV
tara:strand:+ start:3367 stop:3786 length:420 start_codon:yes stop_codon:yes gene_type:complete